MKTDDVTSKGLTVAEQKSEDFVEKVRDGVPPKKAAKEVGASLAALRKTGVLARAVRELLDRVESEKLLDKKNADQLARARLVELMMQDQDLKVAMNAVKTQLDTGRPGVAIQLNQNLITDPGVIESLKSLQLEIDQHEPK